MYVIHVSLVFFTCIYCWSWLTAISVPARYPVWGDASGRAWYWPLHQKGHPCSVWNWHPQAANGSTETTGNNPVIKCCYRISNDHYNNTHYWAFFCCIIFHPVAQVNNNIFHFHFTQTQLIFKVLSNEHVTCNFKVAPCFECPLTIIVQIGWKKRGEGGGKHLPVYKMIYWEDKYMDYSFHEISSVDKIQVHIIIIESSCRINIQDSYRILSTVINWWYFQDITCIWSPISSRRRRRL